MRCSQIQYVGRMIARIVRNINLAEKPCQMLDKGEWRRFRQAAKESGLREYALVASPSTTRRALDHLERTDLAQWAFSPA
jgi:hypothetical protein